MRFAGEGAALPCNRIGPQNGSERIEPMQLRRPLRAVNCNTV